MSNSSIGLNGFLGRSKDRNYLINGSFEIWQRGITFGGLGDGITTETIYTADRWIALNGGAGVTVSRQDFADTQSEIPGYPKHYFRYDMRGTTGSHPCIMQKVEGVRTLAGKQVAVSYWARATGITAGTTSGILSTTQLPAVFRMRQFLGVGGTGSTGLTSNTVQHTTGLTLTGTWTQFNHTFQLNDLSGMTFGTTGTDFLSFELRLPGGTHGVNPVAGGSGDIDITNVRTVATGGGSNLKYVVDIANAQLEERTSTEFERRPIQEELLKCQRYYMQTFMFGTTSPAAGLGITNGAIGVVGASAGFGTVFNFPTQMRTPPAVRMLGHTVSGGNFATGIGATANAISATRCSIFSNGGSPSAGTIYYVHATVSAEI